METQKEIDDAVSKIDSTTCPVCKKVSKSVWGTRKHYITTHTKLGAERMRESARRGVLTRKSNLRALAPVTELEPIPKRHYTKRATIQLTDSSISELIHVKHCPVCGCDAHAVEVALRFAKIRPNNP